MRKHMVGPVMRLVGLIALVVGTLLVSVLGSGPVAAQDGTAPGSRSALVDVPPQLITTGFTPTETNESCLTFPLGVIHSAGSTDTEFVITIRVNRPLCQVVLATPAVYAMPSDTVAWPQTLVERGRLVMQQAGVYEVRFAKTCAPQQFDLIAGDSPSVTPQTIKPTGPWHGPLLFPFDLNTALQWPGCRTPRTSTTTTTTTTSTTVPSTTAPSTTAPTTTAPTTTAPTTTASTTTVPADVAGETTVVVPTTTAQVLGVQQTNANLAFTGVGTKPALFGAVLIAFGLCFMLLGRKPVSER